jgi:hypothetical protein
MPVDDGPGKPVGINKYSLSRAATERLVSYNPSIPIESFDLVEQRLVIVQLGGAR